MFRQNKLVKREPKTEPGGQNLKFNFKVNFVLTISISNRFLAANTQPILNSFSPIPPTPVALQSTCDALRDCEHQINDNYCPYFLAIFCLAFLSDTLKRSILTHLPLTNVLCIVLLIFFIRKMRLKTIKDFGPNLLMKSQHV